MNKKLHYIVEVMRRSELFWGTHTIFNAYLHFHGIPIRGGNVLLCSLNRTPNNSN